MERIVYLDIFQGAKRRVLVEDGVPVEIAFEENQKTMGNIYIGRVMQIQSHLNSVFVDIGQRRNAFLPMSEVVCFEETAKRLECSSIRQGQEIIVQVTKDPLGDKGAKLTMKLSFPGKYCVLLPTIQAVGVSRQIDEPIRRERLNEIAQAVCPENMGILIRTAAKDASDALIMQEASGLHAKWVQLKAHAGAQKAPTLLFSAGSLLEDSLRDLNATILEEPLPDPLEKELKTALQRKIWLKSGAYLVIDSCEALTAIDVNSGKYTAKSNATEAIVRLNCEAAAEAARQIRLRDIGGIIVIDFIDMASVAERDAVLLAFTEAMRNDRAKRHVHGFSAAGLLELTRRSVYQPLESHHPVAGE